MPFFSIQLARLLSVFIALTIAGAHARAAVTIEDIIENVRRNERLYENIDVVLDTHYTIEDREPNHMVGGGKDGDSETLDTQLRTHYVGQNGLFRLDMEGTTRSEQNEYIRDRIRAFDGTTTRLLDQRAIGNIIRGREDEANIIRPHMLLLRVMQFNFPLSTYMSGDVALLADPSASAWWERSQFHLDVEYLGEAEHEGLLCHRVALTTCVKGAGPYGRWELWLAEDRNYLPVRDISYGLKFCKDIPDADALVTDLREIVTGIWFPFAARNTAYNQIILARERKQVFQWREVYQFESASLNPGYPKSYFTDIEFPEGVAVYEIENSQITRSVREGAPSARRTTWVDSVGRSWLFYGNIVVISTAVVWLFARRRRPR